MQLFARKLSVELWFEIATYLDKDGQKLLSQANNHFRTLVLPFLFREIYYRGEVCIKLSNLNNATAAIKNLIKKLDILYEWPSDMGEDDSGILYSLASTLPKLQVFIFKQIEHLVPTSEIVDLISSLKTAPLQDFVLDLYTAESHPLRGMPVEGLTGLKRLSIKWEVGNPPNEPDRGNYLRHLEALIVPSVQSLVDLTIFNVPFDDDDTEDLDLFILQDAGPTLRKFDYTLRSTDDTILEIIPQIFPNLEDLAIRWSPSMTFGYDSISWENAYADSLAKNLCVVNLTLSFDFEVARDDVIRRNRHIPWFIRCYNRRYEATKQLCDKMPLLRQCTWVQYHAEVHVSPLNTAMHEFVIQERGGGEDLIRVVRGIKQRWMGKIHVEPPLQGVSDQPIHTDARLENLPGEIIGQNKAPT